MKPSVKKRQKMLVNSLVQVAFYLHMCQNTKRLIIQGGNSLMKRIFALILLLTMLLPSLGFTEFDFESMTDEQLLKLNSELTAELFKREKVAFLPVGWYVIGEEIPEGVYWLLFKNPSGTSNISEQSEDDSYVHCFIYENIEKYEAGEPLSYLFINEEIDSVDKMSLKQGNILEIRTVGLYIKTPEKAIVIK